jgi:cysteine desulfurase family protein (TIGR01976 family)
MISDILSIKDNFPALKQDMTFFDNAGGTQVAKQVTERLADYLLNTNVQLGASYKTSVESGKRVMEAQRTWAKAINATSTNEIVFGSSTTALLQNLSRSLVKTYEAGDEVIVTNTDHEANIGPWVKMREKGIIIKTWEINRDTLQLELEDLEKLISPKTKLVAFTHVSNILGTINPVKEITEFVHYNGAQVCVDGVAYAPHRLIDVKKWDVDFYVFSLYKVYGPHYSLLYGKRDALLELPGINHYFIEKDDIPYKLQPGNVNYELSYSSIGIIDYLENLYDNLSENRSVNLHTKLKIVFESIAEYEEKLASHLLEYLNNNSKIRVIGSNNADRKTRVPTISFTIDGIKNSEIPLLVDKHQIGIRWGDFYARRLIEYLDLAKNDGVVRVSMVHYNTIDEVERLIEILKNII